MSGPIQVEIKNLISTNKFGGGVFLGNDQKTFAIFIGPDEMNALVLAGQGIQPPRPLTHNLIESILIGFDIQLVQAIVSDLVEETFCATLVLERTEQDGTRHEVRIDCRPSDAMVLATLRGKPIFVESHVFEQVEDQGELLEALKMQVIEEIQKKVSKVQEATENLLGKGKKGEPGSKGSNRIAKFLDEQKEGEEKEGEEPEAEPDSDSDSDAPDSDSDET